MYLRVAETIIYRSILVLYILHCIFFSFAISSQEETKHPHIFLWMEKKNHDVVELLCSVLRLFSAAVSYSEKVSGLSAGKCAVQLLL